MTLDELAMQIGLDRLCDGIMFSVVFAWLVVLSLRKR